MNSTTAPTPNRYAGPCVRCGAKVPAGAGIYGWIDYPGAGSPTGSTTRGCAHSSEADCKTTTKTWGNYDRARRHHSSIGEQADARLAAGFAAHWDMRPMTTGCDSSLRSPLRLADGRRYEVKIGGQTDRDSRDDRMLGHRLVRFFDASGSEVGRLTLDRDAVDAARASTDDPYEGSVLAEVERLRQIVAAAEALR